MEEDIHKDGLCLQLLQLLGGVDGDVVGESLGEGEGALVLVLGLGGGGWRSGVLGCADLGVQASLNVVDDGCEALHGESIRRQR